MDAKMETIVGVSCWTFCSVGMMVCNKAAIGVFPEECTLTALQMLVSIVILLALCFRSIHIGSAYDVLCWSAVTPFFAGMLLTSMLALKHAPMTLSIVFRSLSPILALVIERFYPNPLRLSQNVIASLGVMIVGTMIYASQLGQESLIGIQWVLLNMVLAVIDRCLQRLMLAKDQHPVDISKSGVTLLNNALGLLPLVAAAYLTSEFKDVPGSIAGLTSTGWAWVIASCLVGCGISYTGIWAQSLISATSFLVLVNGNKFVIILLEGYVLHNKVLNHTQIIGACITVTGGIFYALARQALEAEAAKAKEDNESAPLTGKTRLV